ncbi:ATP-binding protein [Hyphomonas oceanitis]|uniref:histidine kinase n=1 Tax=Hyphomonas oceanitis SCH89 TaxID=1280953 RepID=A0A059G6Q3_9PROT|nr:ATP-binding protein [Hyphomonas oceanitis]KDA02517.1 sensor histidine kinase [Hyphomonas oceanitis SCH89]
MARLRDITPRGLYARSLLMVVAPVVLILALMTWYYYDSHLAEVNRKLAQAIARDAAQIQSFCDARPDTLFTKEKLQRDLDMTFTCDYADPADGSPRLIHSFAYGKTLTEELTIRLGVPVDVSVDPRTMLHFRFPSGSGTAEILIERKRALVVNSHFFIVWVIASSLLMLALAVAFLNQQVRSILRLSEAARAFGRGRDAPGFRPSGATEVRDAARALLDMKSRLTAFADQRSAMLAGVSHDLRTPLTRLKLSLAMMEQSEDLAAAQSDLDDMAMMLDEYLTFARGEEGDEPMALDLAELVREAAAGFGAHVPVVGPTSISATGRPLALKRAINNLISNAVKYATDVRVTVLDGPHAAEVHVDDNGPGIAPERREEAFRPFSRLDEARTQNTSGTGLGLTLARDTARAHGGDLRLSDSVLGGLRASLRLPH